MRKLIFIALAALLLLALGCSGNPGVTPTDRETLDEFLANAPAMGSNVGTFTITDLDGNLVAEGTVLREDNNLSLGEIRNGEILIDLTWIGWLDLACEFYNARWYQPNGWPVYYYGDMIKYDVCITNYAITIPNANVRTQHRYFWGPKAGDLLPGSTEWWYNVYLPACQVTKLYDEYHAVYHGWIAVWGLVEFNFNLWCLEINIILYNGICGLWEP